MHEICWGPTTEARAAVCPLSGGTEVLCCAPQGVAIASYEDGESTYFRFFGYPAHLPT